VDAGFEASLGQDLEQRSLAHLRQADDAGFHSAIVSDACGTLSRIFNIKGFTTKDTKMQKPRASPQRTRRSHKGARLRPVASPRLQPEQRCVSAADWLAGFSCAGA